MWRVGQAHSLVGGVVGFIGAGIGSASLILTRGHGALITGTAALRSSAGRCTLRDDGVKRQLATRFIQSWVLGPRLQCCSGAAEESGEGATEIVVQGGWTADAIVVAEDRSPCTSPMCSRGRDARWGEEFPGGDQRKARRKLHRTHRWGSSRGNPSLLYTHLNRQCFRGLGVEAVAAWQEGEGVGRARKPTRGRGNVC